MRTRNLTNVARPSEDLDRVLAMPCGPGCCPSGRARAGLAAVALPSLSLVTAHAVEPSERIAELFQLDRPFTMEEQAEWDKLTGGDVS